MVEGVVAPSEGGGAVGSVLALVLVHSMASGRSMDMLSAGEVCRTCSCFSGFEHKRCLFWVDCIVAHLQLASAVQQCI